MMKKVVYSVVAVVLVLVLIFIGLGTLGGRKSESSSAPSTSMTSKNGASSSSSSTSSDSTDASSSQANQATAPSSSVAADAGQATTASSSAPSNQAQVAPASSMDLSAIGQGDYSSLAGTWTNDQGDQLLVAADGSVTVKMSNGSGREYKDQLSNPTLRGDLAFATAVHEGGAYSDPIFMIPAGAALPVSGQASQTDRLQYGSDAQWGEDHFFSRS